MEMDTHMEMEMENATYNYVKWKWRTHTNNAAREGNDSRMKQSTGAGLRLCSTFSWCLE